MPSFACSSFFHFVKYICKNLIWRFFFIPPLACSGFIIMNRVGFIFQPRRSAGDYGGADQVLPGQVPRPVPVGVPGDPGQRPPGQGVLPTLLLAQRPRHPTRQGNIWEAPFSSVLIVRSTSH